MSYDPAQTPTDINQMVAFLDNELQKLKNAINFKDFLPLSISNVAPTKPQDGIYYADGTNWDPGLGVGFYAYRDGAWEYIGGSVKDFYTEVAKGNIAGHSLVHKFGRNSAIGTSLAPICQGGFYRTPQVSGVVTIAAISTSANDTAAGTGAREITVVYLDSTGAEQTGTIAMNGTTETTGTITGVMRITRIWVSASGSYASQTTPSQVGTITVRVAGAGATWATLTEASTGFGNAQSLIGAYTVPLGKTAYILSTNMTVDSGKTVSLFFFKRNNILETAAPYTALRVQNIYTGVGSSLAIEHQTHESYPELTDIGYLAKTSTGTADVSVEFELLLVDN